MIQKSSITALVVSVCAGLEELGVPAACAQADRKTSSAQVVPAPEQKTLPVLNKGMGEEGGLRSLFVARNGVRDLLPQGLNGRLDENVEKQTTKKILPRALKGEWSPVRGITSLGTRNHLFVPDPENWKSGEWSSLKDCSHSPSSSNSKIHPEQGVMSQIMEEACRPWPIPTLTVVVGGALALIGAFSAAASLEELVQKLCGRCKVSLRDKQITRTENEAARRRIRETRQEAAKEIDCLIGCASHKETMREFLRFLRKESRKQKVNSSDISTEISDICRNEKLKHELHLEDIFLRNLKFLVARQRQYGVPIRVEKRKLEKGAIDWSISPEPS